MAYSSVNIVKNSISINDVHPLILYNLFSYNYTRKLYESLYLKINILKDLDYVNKLDS